MYHFFKKSGIDLWQWHYRNRKKNCGNAIAEIGRKKKLWQSNCSNGIVEIGKKNCENLIVVMPLPKQGNKKNLAIVAMALPKMEGKKKRFRNLWKSKKNKKYHIHNIFTTFS